MVVILVLADDKILWGSVRFARLEYRRQLRREKKSRYLASLSTLLPDKINQPFALSEIDICSKTTPRAVQSQADAIHFMAPRG